MRQYLDLVYGGREGFVAVAYGRSPYRDERDRYRHGEWRELRYRWPAERESLVRELEQEMSTGEPVDIYVAPAMRVSNARNGFGGRHGSNSAPPRWLWADCDREIDRAKLAKLDALIVNSGQPGHRHVYVPLNEPVPVAEHRVLNKALAAYLGGDAKWGDDALLRLPGTLNFKPTVPAAGGQPGAACPVAVYKVRARVWTVEGIAELLGVDLTATQNGATHTTFIGATEPPPDSLPSRVTAALAHPDVTDRSKAHARVVGACLDAGLTLGQTVSVCATYPPSVDKYGARLADEVARFWAKARAERTARAGCGTDDLVPLDADPGSTESRGQKGQNPSNGVVSSLLSPRFGDVWDSPISLEWITTDIPVDALGDILGPLVRAVAHSYQVHTDLVVGLALPTITTAIRGQLTIRIKPDWSETMALATVTVARSAERKSPLHRLIITPLSEHEAAEKEKARTTIAREKAALQFEQDKAEQLRKAALKSMSEDDKNSYLAAAEDVANMAATLTPPPRWIASDATPEAIVRLLADHGAVGVLSSEPGLFAIMAGRYSGGRRNVETVLQATSGDSVIVDRADSDRSVNIDRPALSCSMCIQNGRLPELNLPEFIESGLIARLLFTLPPSIVGYRKFDVTPVPKELLTRWSSAIKDLAATKRTGEIALTNEAARALAKFGEEIEPELRPHEGTLAGIGSWAGKLPGQCARIAAALTLLTNPNATAIEETEIKNAIRIGRAYMTHSLSAFSVIRQRDDRINQAHAVLHTILKKKWHLFTVRDLLRAMHGQAWVDGVADLEPALAVLVERSHIRLAEDDTRTGGEGPRHRRTRSTLTTRTHRNTVTKVTQTPKKRVLSLLSPLFRGVRI